MVSPMTSVSPPTERALGTTRVVAAVLAVHGGVVQRAVDAVRSSVYEVERIAVIAGTAAEETSRHNSLAALMETLDPSVDVVWILHSDAVPRPDALGALVTEMERNDASLVGSKIMGMDGEKLESVGAATDVFGEPYSGLDPEEVDLEQYDVVRDVAMVSGVSTLVRRDLLRGLGGIDDVVPPGASGQDLSQRARLAGGRVMIVPSSEVLHIGNCREDVAVWRLRAGRFRSMLKVYGPLTLLWMIPLAVVVGLFDGIARLFLRQPKALFEQIMVIVWNLTKLPGTLAARFRVRAIRQVGDEELFRYQLPGSVLLRNLGTDIGERFGWVIDSEPGLITEQELESESSRAVPVVIAISLVLLGIASRSLLVGSMPASRFALPLEADWLGVLSSYAGSWNPAGLGSLQPVHPSVALSAVIQGALAGWSGATQVMTVLALIGGVIGFGRLTDRLGLSGPSRYLATVVMFLGPFAALIGAAGDWAGLLALGAFPWFVDLSIAKWPSGWVGRIGRVGAIFVAAALLGSAAPVALLTGVAAVVAISLFHGGVGASSLLTAVLALDLGVFAISPYVAGITSDSFWMGGATVELKLGPFTGGALIIAGVVSALSGSGSARRAAGAGLTMVVAATAGGLFSLTGETSGAAAILGAIGAALVVAAAFAIDLERKPLSVALQSVGLVAAIFVLATSLLPIGPGRIGLPSDEWSERLDFVASLSDDPEAVRSLVVGLPDSLPGDSRIGRGYAYRLISSDQATSAEARLAPMRIGDGVLAETLARIDLGDELRPGQQLADFGVGWVVVLDRMPFADLLSAQLDLTEVGLVPGVRVFRNDAFVPRITTSSGTWDAGYVGATGRADPAGTVRLADNASVRFGPNWEQDSWANSVSGIDGEITYRPIPMRRSLAYWVAGVFAASLIAAVALRERSPKS